MPDPFDPRNTSVGFAVELSFGSITGVSSVTKIPFQSYDVRQPTDTVISQTITGDRAPLDLLRTSVHAEVNLGFEMIAVEYDEFIEQAMMDDAGWSSGDTNGPGTTFDISGSTDTINDSGGGFDSAYYVPGRWMHLSGVASPDGSLDGFYKIVTQTTTAISVSPPMANVITGSGDTITIKAGQQVVNGKTLRSFTMESQHDESTDKHIEANGCSVNEWSMTVSIGEIITGNFTMMGTKVRIYTGSSEIDTGPTQVLGNKPMTAVDHVVEVIDFGAGPDQRLEILGADFTVNNNLAVREIVGQLGPAKKHRADLFEASGTLRIYFEDETFLNHFYQFDTHQLALLLRDGDGNAYVLDWPALKFSDANVPVQGGQDLVVELPWAAFKETESSVNEGVAMRVARFTGV